MPQSTIKTSILVTGGAGYIGSHVCLALIEAGHRPIVLDNLSTGDKSIVPAEAAFIYGDVGDRAVLRSLFSEYDIAAVIHLAGSIIVSESVEEPLKYYRNNTCNTEVLLEEVVAAGVRHVVFSSTAAVYGIPEQAKVSEISPLSPINPYGSSKLMTEWMLRDASAAGQISYVALRYFNVSGADPDMRAGQVGPNSTHLIRRACDCVDSGDVLQVFGADYDTNDGTCIRDYIHVSDLAAAHVEALEYLCVKAESNIFNVGYGVGYSVLEIADAIARVAGRELKITKEGRRPGDPPSLVADNNKLINSTSWFPHYNDIDLIVRTALNWQRSRR